MTRATVVVLHVLSAVVGFGAIFLSGVYAGLARRRPSGAVRRYFRPGPNWAARGVYLVPVLGVVLVETSHGADRFAQVWVWVSILLWVLVAALAHAVVWPGERRIQQLVAGLPPTGIGARQAELDRACRRVERAAVAIDLTFVATLVLMVAKPGSGG
ncbi:MAG TPA: DUF2269 family protein [Acidimicrobiales bacterium]